MCFQNKLKNEKLYETVKCTMEDLGYQTPIIEFYDEEPCCCAEYEVCSEIK